MWSYRTHSFSRQAAMTDAQALRATNAIATPPLDCPFVLCSTHGLTCSLSSLQSPNLSPCRSNGSRAVVRRDLTRLQHVLVRALPLPFVPSRYTKCTHRFTHALQLCTCHTHSLTHSLTHSVTHTHTCTHSLNTYTLTLTLTNTTY